MFHSARKPAPDAVTTLILSGPGAGDGPPWAATWAATDPGVVLGRLDEAHHALPEVRAFETAHLIIANPGAIAVADGLGATVLLQLLQSWPNLTLAAALLVDPVDTARGTPHAAFGPLPEAPLPLPAILYLSTPATSRHRSLARRWDCVLAEAGGGTGDVGAGALPRLRSLRDQLARIGTPAAATAADVMSAEPFGPPPLVPVAEPVPAEVARRGIGRPLPLPRILF